MKKTVSYSLEEDIIKTIVDYKKKYNLSSNSAALERIILEYRNGSCSNMEEILNELRNSLNNSKDVKMDKVKLDENDPLKNAFDEAYNDMPD